MASERVEKRKARQRRVRKQIRGSAARPRLSIYRSLHHIYAQVISDESGRTIAACSTLAEGVKGAVRSACSLDAAKAVGKAIADRCLEKGIREVIFDRNGFLYHGRVKAVADAAREAGLKL